VPLACILRLADPPRRAARQARPLTDRPEPPLAPRRDDDERRRLRRRLVRGGRAPTRLSQHPSGLERSQSPRARGRHLLPALLLAHPRVDRRCHPGDKRSSVPARPLAVDAQRAHSRVPEGATRAAAACRRRLVHLDRRHDRLGDDVLSGAHLRARERSRRCARADRRLHRGNGPQAQHRAADSDDGRDDERREHLGIPLLERARLALALLHHADGYPQGDASGAG